MSKGVGRRGVPVERDVTLGWGGGVCGGGDVHSCGVGSKFSIFCVT